MKWWILILVVCAGCYTPPKAKRFGAAVPAAVTLGWTASPSPEVTGYVIYYRSVTTTNRVDVGPTLTHTISNLVAGTTYTFHATAYEGNGVESEPSASIDYTPSLPPLPPQDLRIVITPQTSDSLNGPWLAVESWPALTLTNPVGQRFFRYDITKGNP